MKNASYFNCMSTVREILKKIEKQQETMVKWRRDFHAIPELKFEEYETTKLLESILRTMDVKIQKPSNTGIVADIQGTKPGPVVALRADIDALPIQEETDLPYKSTIPGRMHACGHDAHMTMLLGAVDFLRQQQFNGTIRAIFQAGEEGGAGAKELVEKSVLDDVSYIYGMHVWPETKSGTVLIREGELLAGADAFTIKITGKGGHAARPHMTSDPSSIAPDIINAIHKLISREVNAFDYAVVSMPFIQGSQAFNIIPSEFVIKGTLRTTSMEIRHFLLKRIEEIAMGFATAWRCSAEVFLDCEYYPPVVNESSACAIAKRAVETFQESDRPVAMVSEDFSFYLEQTPGAFLLLGNGSKDSSYPLHHPRFTLDESILSKGAAIHSALALRTLDEIS
jgi:amidohydrolase